MAAKSLEFIESAQYLQSLLDRDNRNEMIAKNPPPSAQARNQAAIDAITKNIGAGSIKQPNVNSDNVWAGINQQKTTIEELNVRVNQLSKQLDQLKSFITHQFAAKYKNQ